MSQAGSRGLWALYAGGFLGPFGGGVLTPMLPEVSVDFGVTISTAGLGITTYLVPFAGMLLVSGTLAERWGRDRTLRLAYAVYILSSLAAVLAPTFGVFLVSRGVQGVANAFVTPVLVAALSDRAPASRLGRTLGLFGSVQASGQAFSPFVGGLATEYDWRWAFVAAAVAAAVLVVATPRSRRTAAAPATRGTHDGPRSGGVASLRRPGVIVAGLAAAAGYLTMSGLTLLGALLATDRFGEGPTARGLVVAAFGVAGFVAGPVAGRALDRIGAARSGMMAGIGMSLAAVVAAISPHLAILVAALFAGGMAGTALRASTSYLAVTTAPENRGGAASLVLGVQFVGAALAPVLWLPIYATNQTAAMAAASSGGLIAMGLLSALVRRR